MNDDPLASRWQRLKGYLLDLLISGGLLYLLLSLSDTIAQIRYGGVLSIGQRLLWALISLVVFVTLNGYLLATEGQTLGKQLVRTRIVDLNGERLPFAKLIILRYVILFIVSIPIVLFIATRFMFLWGPMPTVILGGLTLNGLPKSIPLIVVLIGLLDGLWIFGREKRCLHDVLAGTKVVAIRPELIPSNSDVADRPGEVDTEAVIPESGLTPAGRRILQGAGLIAVILVGLIFYRGSLLATGERLQAGNYQLAFLKAGDVYGLDVEQGTVTQLTLNHKIGSIAWTPDGQEMILNWNPHYLLNVSTGEAKQLNGQAVTPGLNGWSPDGQQRVFWDHEQGDADTEIYVIQAGDTQKRRLVQNPGTDGGPAWSPDGQQVAFWTHREEESWSLSVVNADGANLKQIVQSPTPFAPRLGSDLVWSPDGHKLLFISPTELTQRGGPEAAHLYMIDVDGQNLIDVGGIVLWSPQAPWGSPRWSPDGRTIAFSALCLFNLDDDEPDCGTSGESPSWSPDGRYLAYVTYRSPFGRQPQQICVRLMATGRERCFEETKTRGSERISALVWRP